MTTQKNPNNPADATSSGNTIQDNHAGDRFRQNNTETATNSTLEKVIPDDVATARRSFPFRPWVSNRGLVEFLRRKGFHLNEVLNSALCVYLGQDGQVDRLRDFARLSLLMAEEKMLVRYNKMMLRSGAYLDLYAQKVLKGGVSRDDAKLGRKPLDAYAPNETPIFKRNTARREAIIKESVEIMSRVLPEEEYVLKNERENLREHAKRQRSTKSPLI